MTPISKTAQETANRQIVEAGEMKLYPVPQPDTLGEFKRVAAFKLEMNNWMWERRDVLDYYNLVDEINASIHAATDKAARMAKWREWATKTRLALRYLDGVVELGHTADGIDQLSLAWNVQAFNKKILPAWEEFDALRQGLRVQPRMADVDESGQRFDDPNYLPFLGKNEG